MLSIPFFPLFASNPEHFEPLPDGHAGTIRTLELMRFLCRRDFNSPFVSLFVGNLLQGSPGRGVAETLFLFARDGIGFREDAGPNREENIERLADFQRTSELGYGDCDDKVIWLCTGLLNQGISCRFRIQSYTSETWDHVYCDYWDWGRWHWRGLDPTADGHSGIVAQAGWRQPLPASGMEMIFPV
jgi:hypothetical protein